MDTLIQRVLVLAPELGSFIKNTRQNELVTIGTVEALVPYTLRINTSDFSYTSGGSPTNVTIAAGLVLAVNAGSEPVTAQDNLDGTFNLLADDAGHVFSADVDTDFKLAISSVVTPSYNERLVAQILEDVTIQVSTLRFQAETERAQRYLAAHLLTVAKGSRAGSTNSSAAGDVIKEKVGEVEIWYSDGGGDSDGLSNTGLSSTNYGKIFLEIRKRHSLRFI